MEPDWYGSTNPRRMPDYLFKEAVFIDFESAVRANIDRQYFTCCPRHWYIDARFRCARCASEFIWSIDEQRAWFEEYRFWIEVRPQRCLACRRELRALTALRQEYDREVSAVCTGGSYADTERMLAILEALEAETGRLPRRMLETRARLRRRLSRLPREG